MEKHAQTASRWIADKLIRRIASGRYAVDTRLPTERELSEEFQVTRHVVREALKRLEALGMVRIRQGSGIYVQNLPLTGGIELFDVLMTSDDGTVNLPFLRSVLEFRGQMYRSVVRLAATRCTREELDAIRAIVRERAESHGDPERLGAIMERLFDCVVTATHNEIYRLMVNTMGRLSIHIGTLVDLPLMGFEQTQSLLERVVDAFEHRDRDMADMLMARYLDMVEESLRSRMADIGLPA